MENAAPRQNENMPLEEPKLTDWVVPPSAAEERKQIAKLFESFLVSKMQSGAIEVDPAKETAELFVKIFQDATSNDRLEKALDALNKQNDQLLKSFYLRVSEMRLQPVRKKLYDFMVELVHLGKVKEARDLYALYSNGSLHDINGLLEIEKQMVSAKEVSAAASKIADFLKEQNKTTEAQKLQEALDGGNIKTLEDLKSWENMVINSPGGSEFTLRQSSSQSVQNSELSTSPIPTSEFRNSPNSQMNFGQRVWEGVHRLDRNLRNMLGMK